MTKNNKKAKHLPFPGRDLSFSCNTPSNSLNVRPSLPFDSLLAIILAISASFPFFPSKRSSQGHDPFYFIQYRLREDSEGQITRRSLYVMFIMVIINER